MARHINAAGMRLIRQFEGDRLESYLCPAGVWTISVGVTGPGIGPGMKITQAQSDALFAETVQRFADGVDRLVTVPISENQRAALVSLAYNIGLKAFEKSTLLRLLNSGDTVGSGRQILLWSKSGGRVMPGLVMRRQAELALYQRPDRG